MAAAFVGAEVLVNEGAGWGSCGVGRVMWQQADEGKQRLIVVGPAETVLASADLPDKAVRFTLSAGTVLRVLPMDSAEWALSFSSTDDAAQVWEDVNMLYGAADGSAPPGSPMFGIGDDSFVLPAEMPNPTTDEGLEQLEAVLQLLHGMTHDDPARASLVETMASSEAFGTGGALAHATGGRPTDFMGTLTAAYAEHEARIEVAAASRASRGGSLLLPAVEDCGASGGNTGDGGGCAGSGAAAAKGEAEGNWERDLAADLEAASGRFGRIAKLLLTLEEGSLLRRVLRDDAAPFLFGALEYEARVSFVLGPYLFGALDLALDWRGAWGAGVGGGWGARRVRV